MPWGQLGREIAKLFAARTGRPLDGLLQGGRELPDDQLPQLRKKLEQALNPAAQNGNGAAATGGGTGTGTGASAATPKHLKTRAPSGPGVQLANGLGGVPMEQKPLALEAEQMTDATPVSFQRFARQPGKIRVKLHKLRADEEREACESRASKAPQFLDYTLWEYVYNALRLLTDCEFHKRLWTEGLVYGFLSLKQARHLLEEAKSPPMVIVRFSENQPGAITCTGYYYPNSSSSSAASTTTSRAPSTSAASVSTLTETTFDSLSLQSSKPIVEALEPWDLKAL